MFSAQSVSDIFQNVYECFYAEIKSTLFKIELGFSLTKSITKFYLCRSHSSLCLRKYNNADKTTKASRLTPYGSASLIRIFLLLDIFMSLPYPRRFPFEGILNGIADKNN